LRLIGGEGAAGPQHHHKNSKEPPHHAENLPDAAAKSVTARGALARRGGTGMTANVDRRAS